MGQYHILVNLTKKEWVNPHELGLGLKQWEHGLPGASGSLYENGTIPQALYFLTMTSVARGGGDFDAVSISGRWAGDVCVVLGDYTEDADLPGVPNAGSLYGEVTSDGTYRDISDLVVEGLGEVFRFSIDTGSIRWKDRVPYVEKVILPIT